MRLYLTALALVPALTLSSCERAGAPTPEATTQSTVAASTVEPVPVPISSSTRTAEPSPLPTDGINDGYPDLTPPKLTAKAAKGEKGARDFLLYFARAIELKEFDQAWTMLSPGDKQKWSKTAFAAMFADLGKIIVAIPAGTSEGAAGSIYYTSPITITANDKAGRPVRIEGESVLRRVNDVDGATPAQLRWHFDHVTLEWTH